MKDHVQGLLESLGLPWHILRLCGGDMSFTSAITFDFEVYSAAQERWLEVSSVSNFETYQANRLKCRYRGEDKKTQRLGSRPPAHHGCSPGEQSDTRRYHCSRMPAQVHRI